MESGIITLPAPRPHDLLRLAADPDVLPVGAPFWARASLIQTPWVVVRRATAPQGQVAVGVRGNLRAQRFAMTLPSTAIEQIVTPERLCADGPPEDRELPAFAALRLVRLYLNSTGLRWGPTGSVGFELATGRQTVNADSDLDVILRVADVNASLLQQLSALQEKLSSVAGRVDCQVEIPAGAVALAEIASPHPRVMVRTKAGPCLQTAAELGQ
jgi:phosphoribosyl-dephospho-CoA transferase